MNDTDILHLGGQAIAMIGELSAPLLVVSLAVGIVVSLVQTVLSLQDQTLSMVPRLALTALVLLVAGSWMLHTMVDYTTDLFNSIPALVR